MHILSLVTVLIVFVMSCKPVPRPVVDLDKIIKTVSHDSVEAHIRYLADDRLSGRYPGTAGYEKAAHYVETKLHQYGVQPAGEDGTYRQAVNIREAFTDDGKSSLSLARDGLESPLVRGDDYFFFPNLHATETDILADVVFAGFGIFAPEFAYDDYENLDVNRNSGTRNVCIVAFKHPRQRDLDRSSI